MGGVSVGKIMHTNTNHTHSQQSNNHKDILSNSNSNSNSPNKQNKYIKLPEYNGSNWIGSIMKTDEGEDNLCDVYENGFSLLMQEK